MKYIKNTNDKALELRVNFRDSSIQACQEVINQLECLWEGFNESKIIGSQNHILCRINEWEEVKSILETFPKIEEEDVREIQQL